MIADDKEWLLRQLGRMRQACAKADSNGKKRQDYGSRIKWVDKMIGFIENKEGGGLIVKKLEDNNASRPIIPTKKS